LGLADGGVFGALQVLRLRGDIVGLRKRQLRPADGEPRFRLRHVGARDLAGGEAVAPSAVASLRGRSRCFVAARGWPPSATSSCRQWRRRAARSARSCAARGRNRAVPSTPPQHAQPPPPPRSRPPTNRPILTLDYGTSGTRQ